MKVRGIIVGEVRKIRTSGDGRDDHARAATRAGEDDPEQRHRADPAQDAVRREVRRADPARRSRRRPIHGRATSSTQDHSRGALEAQTVLGDLLPLLAGGQAGRAERHADRASPPRCRTAATNSGQNLVDFDKYLTTFNPHVPKLVDDLNKLGQVALEYNSAAPDIIATLNNLQTSSRTLIDKQAAFRTVLATATSTSDLLIGVPGREPVAADHGGRHVAPDLRPARRVRPGVHLRDQRHGHDPDPAAHRYAGRPGPPQRPGRTTRRTAWASTCPATNRSSSAVSGPTASACRTPPVPFKVPGSYRCINDGAALTTDACSQNAIVGRSPARARWA